MTKITKAEFYDACISAASVFIGLVAGGFVAYLLASALGWVK